MSEVLAVILSRPINVALDELFFCKISFLFLIESLLTTSFVELSVSSKLGFNSFRLIKGAVKILSSANVLTHLLNS